MLDGWVLGLAMPSGQSIILCGIAAQRRLTLFTQTSEGQWLARKQMYPEEAREM